LDNFPLGDPESEQEFAGDGSFLGELHQSLRGRAAAYWLFVPWVCASQTMHGDLSPADRLLAASCAFCTVLWMVAMREFVAPEFRPLERKSQGSGKMGWG
jgi:hypothetical protein